MTKVKTIAWLLPGEKLQSEIVFCIDETWDDENNMGDSK